MKTCQIRIESATKDSAVGAWLHDTRKVIAKSDHLRNDTPPEIVQVGLDNVLGATIPEIKAIFSKHLSEIKKDYSAKNNGRTYQRHAKPYIRGLVSFSEEPGQSITEQYKTFLDAFQTLTGATVLLATIHHDEKTTHGHFIAVNYNYEKGRQIMRTLGRTGLSKLQTLVGEHFAPLGFSRGEQWSKRKHYDAVVGHWKELQEHLAKVKEISLENEKVRQAYEGIEALVKDQHETSRRMTRIIKKLNKIIIDNGLEKELEKSR
jgi:hypothetical protein